MSKIYSTLGGSAAVRDLLGRTVCMYTANAEAYKTAQVSIGTGNRKMET